MIDFSLGFDAFRASASDAIAAHFQRLQPKYVPSVGLAEDRAFEAAHYAFNAGGKRLRGILVLCSATLTDPQNICRPAAASVAVSVELMHTYSLIHDDLPAIDNDDLRRGKPTTHVAFDEATAILAGDGLQALAMQILANNLLPNNTAPEDTLRLIAELSQAVGFQGMVGGQMLDLIAESATEAFDFETTKRLQAKKTGALIRYAARAGALLNGEHGPILNELDRYGARIGLAFQIVDDLLDLNGDSAVVGKKTGKDSKKATFIDVLGEQGARNEVQRLTMEALQITQYLQDDNNFRAHQDAIKQLANLAEFIANRHL